MAEKFGVFSGTYTLGPLLGIKDSWTYIPDPQFPLKYTRPDGRSFTLNVSFVTDLASTPRLAWAIPGFAPADLERPALVHDYIFEQHHYGIDLVRDMAEANLVLYEACRTEGYSKFRASVIRRCCDWFGKSVWDGAWQHKS